MDRTYVYKILNNSNDKIYIGISSEPYKRFYNHKWFAKRYSDYDSHFTRAILKIGEDNFRLEIVACCFTREFAFELEEKLISQHDKNMLYNSHKGGTGDWSKVNERHRDPEKSKDWRNSISRAWKDPEKRKNLLPSIEKASLVRINKRNDKQKRTKIIILTKSNPKRHNTLARKRFELYSIHNNEYDYLRNGGRGKDILCDVRRGFISVYSAIENV